MSFFLVPSQSSNTPLYPFQMLRTREHASILCLSVISCLGFTFGSLKELGVRHALSSKVPLWIHFSRAHISLIGGGPCLRGWTSIFSNRNHHLTLNPKLKTTSCQIYACLLTHAIHRPNMASDYWQLALDIQNES